MKIVEPSKEDLNKFILEHRGSFQQSYEWGELQESMGRETRKIIVKDSDGAVASALFVRHALPFGKYYWLCPKGPVFASESEAIPQLERLLRHFVPRNDGIFIRIEPNLPADYRLPVTDYRLQKAPKDHNPKATIVVDLEKSEDELLGQMHSKTRYNIKLAERKSVSIKYPVSSIKDFLDLLTKTSKRDQFHLHPMDYYKKLLTLPLVELFGAIYQDQMIAGAMVAVWGDRATYVHGASSYKDRNLMAPHLLHWEIMRQLKKQGLKYYDLGGVSPKWPGVTRFKKGFGGDYERSVGSWDYVLRSFWYQLYKLARKVT